MNMKNILGLVNCHTSPELGPLTESRTLASTSFLGRYAIIDVALSNFCNSGIETISILVRDHLRSTLKHMGTNMNWVTNTKLGHQRVFYNEKGHEGLVPNTDFENILENDWVLYNYDIDYIVVQSAHIMTTIDFRPIFKEHVERGEKATLVYTEIKNADHSFLRENVVDIDEDGYLKSLTPNEGVNKRAKVSIGAIILNRETLFQLGDRRGTFPEQYDLEQILEWAIEKGLFRVHTARYEGYARCFDSLHHYVDYSFELMKPEVRESLFRKDWPIYTKTHDTPPALYGKDSEVVHSFIANGCVIEGEVRDSILCRRVKVGKGAVIRNCVILTNCEIGEGAVLVNVVLDKYSKIRPGARIQGKKTGLLYLKQGANV